MTRSPKAEEFEKEIRGLCSPLTEKGQLSLEKFIKKWKTIINKMEEK